MHTLSTHNCNGSKIKKIDINIKKFDINNKNPTILTNQTSSIISNKQQNEYNKNQINYILQKNTNKYLIDLIHNKNKQITLFIYDFITITFICDINEIQLTIMSYYSMRCVKHLINKQIFNNNLQLHEISFKKFNNKILINVKHILLHFKTKIVYIIYIYPPKLFISIIQHFLLYFTFNNDKCMIELWTL